MERNSDYIRATEDSSRVKSIDCQIIHTMLQDALRHNTVLKVEDEDFIFVRRALSHKSKIRNDKTKKTRDIQESDNNALIDNHVETEESRESKIRQKIVFKKLIFLNTRRMLEILKFKPGENERKKLLNNEVKESLI